MVTEEITSPELVLVSPPELAALARDALPDYELEFEEWTLRVRAALETEAQVQMQEPPPEPEPRPARGPSTLTLGALAFTVLSAAASVAPLVLVIAFR